MYGMFSHWRKTVYEQHWKNKQVTSVNEGEDMDVQENVTVRVSGDEMNAVRVSDDEMNIVEVGTETMTVKQTGLTRQRQVRRVYLKGQKSR